MTVHVGGNVRKRLRGTRLVAPGRCPGRHGALATGPPAKRCELARRHGRGDAGRQVIDRARERLPALQEALRVHLPALLGIVTVELGAGRFTRAICFSTEDEARAAELERPPELQAPDQEARQLLVGPVEFLDLREPWLYAPR